MKNGIKNCFLALVTLISCLFILPSSVKAASESEQTFTLSSNITNAYHNCVEFGEWVITQTPTFTTEGEQFLVCTECGNTVTETVDMLVGKVLKWDITVPDDLLVNFYMNISSCIENTAEVQISIGEDAYKFPVAALNKTGDGLYMASVRPAAAQMSDNITVMVMNNGINSEIQAYTIRQYADTILADKGSYHALIREMLNYGAAAQMYFDYATEKPANTGITDFTNVDIPETVDDFVVNDEVSEMDFYGASLVCRDRIAVRYYFTGDVSKCSFAVNGNSYIPVVEDGMYYIEIPDISTENLDQQITLLATDTEGNQLFVTYSPMNYIVRMNEKGSETLRNLLKALYNVYLAANHKHTVAIDAAVSATCTETGLTEGKHCVVCNEIIVEQKIVASLGHTEVVDPAVAPTCTENGLTEGKHCSACNEVLAAQTEVAVVDHIPCLYDDVYIALAHENATNYPFKNTDGKWYATNSAYSTTTYTLTVPADCTVTVECGLSTSYSSDYFNIKHNSVQMLRLTGNKTESRSFELVSGDTLTFTYYKSGYSSTTAWFKIIDTVAKNVETTSLTAHCTQDVICKNCKSVLYPKTGHHNPVTDPGCAATCTKTGLTDGQICSVCDEILMTKGVISQEDHSYTNNICTVCDYVLTPSTGLIYSLKEDGTYMITGLGTCTDKTIVIPANINGKDVTQIAGGAFLRKGSFTGLYIPGTVKSIGSSAFEDTYFDFIYMEEGVTSVGSNAFSGSYGGNSLIVIPSTVTSIGSQAFMCGADCVVINSQEVASKLTAYDGAGYLLYYSDSALIRSDLSYGGYTSQLGYPAVLVEFMGEQYNSFSHNQHSYEHCEIMDWSGMRCTSCHMLSDFAEVTLDVSADDTDSVTAQIYSEAGKGIMKLSGCGNISNNIPSTYMYLVEEIIIEEGILSVPDYAFDYYSNLEYVTVSSSVASIGSQAFYSCDSLVSIEVSAENQHYMSFDGDLYSKDGTALIQYAIGKKSEAFTIPQGVVSVGASAFYGCDNLTKVVILNGVTNIGDFAFSYCTNLGNIELPSSLTSIGGYAFRGCSKLNQIILPDWMTTIGAYAFYGCTGLESIVLPNSLTSIGSYAFYKCSALIDITIPDSVTSIDGFAFAECTSLTSIAIPNSVTSLGKYVFSKTSLLVCCEAASKPSGWNTDWNRSDSGGNLWIVWNYGGENGVDENGIKWVLLNTGDIAVCGYDGDKTELTIPTSINGKTVTTIIDKAFYNCKTLKNVIVGNIIKSIGVSAFESCTKLESITIPDDITNIGYSAFKNCTMLKTVNLGTNITDIWEYTFYGCTSLTSIVIPDSVTTIGYYAFNGCTSLSSITIGKKVTSIQQSAFEGCVALTEIVLPDGLESIGYSAFEGCTALITIVIPSSVTSIENYAFFDCTNLSIFCVATKEPTGWNTGWRYKKQAGSGYYLHSVTWGYKGS